MGSRMLWAVGLVLMLATVGSGQVPAPPAAPVAPELPEALRLERDNLLLQARVIELETQIAALKSRVVSDSIGKAVPGLISKLEAAAPGWAVDPQTLELKPKTAAEVLSAPAAPVPAAPRAPSAPEQRDQ